MKCAETEALLVDAADDRLDAPSQIGFHAHLESCASCRERAALWRGLVPGLRALAPAPPEAMRARRMMIEIERRLAPSVAPARAPRWRRWLWVPGGLGLAAAAAILLVWLRVPTQPAAPGPAFAAVTRTAGAVMAGGRAVGPAARLDEGTELVVAAAGEAELAVGRGSVLRLWGPARVTLGGPARALALRLDEGRLEAQVAHRLADETFAVVTRDARVEVRGTRFSVGAAARGSWVRVDEGRVEVRFPDGRTRMVGAGETASSVPPEAPAVAPADGAPAHETPAPPETEVCAAATRVCQAAARNARESMRAGKFGRALRLVTAADRETGPARAGAEACADDAAACAGELGYLRAEALRGSGRLGDAVAAYKALDRRGAPAAMRQNALYAAAQLEQRQGHSSAARADYERALAAAPRGALGEEALLGSMESAAAAGDAARAGALARRYLAEFPAALGAATARRLAPSGSRP